MENFDLNYEEDVKIDETALDLEELKQAELVKKYGDHFTYCKNIADKADEKVKLVRSKLVLELFAKPTLVKGAKSATIQAQEAYYRTHKKYIKAKDEWLDAVKDMDDAEIAYKAFAYTKKGALDNLAKLHGQSYFAGPKSARNLHEERKKKSKELGKKIAENRKSKKDKKKKNKKSK